MIFRLDVKFDKDVVQQKRLETSTMAMEAPMTAEFSADTKSFVQTIAALKINRLIEGFVELY